MSRNRRFAEVDADGNITVSEWVVYLCDDSPPGHYACNLCGDVLRMSAVDKATWTKLLDVFVALHEHK